jgi:hypothetical protein
MAVLEFNDFLTDVAATIAEHVTSGTQDASLAQPVAAQNDEHLAEAEALIRRATAHRETHKTAHSEAHSEAPSNAQSCAPSCAPVCAPSPPPPFLLDHEKLVWHFPDSNARLIEELR